MYELKVMDMTCGHCAGRVTQAIRSVDPTARLEIDLPHRQVRIESVCDLAVLTDALAEAGYPSDGTQIK